MRDPGDPALVEQMRWQLQQIQDRKAENDRVLAGLGKANGELGALRTTVASPDGAVTVTAGAGGAIGEVRLSANAMRNDPISLGRLITATVQQAIAAAAHQQVAIVRNHVGREVDPHDVLGPQAKLLAQQPAAPVSSPPPPPAAPRPVPVRQQPVRHRAPEHYDEHFGSVLQDPPRHHRR